MAAKKVRQALNFDPMLDQKLHFYNEVFNELRGTSDNYTQFVEKSLWKLVNSWDKKLSGAKELLKNTGGKENDNSRKDET